MVFIRISGRVESNVWVPTGHGAIGNYNAIATAKLIYGNKTYEVPVITGNALKHWHAYYLAKVYESLGGQMLNEYCRKGVGIRGYKLEGNKKAKTESEAIRDICNDIHGFLIEDEQVKRDSLVKFSFGIPILNESSLETAEKYAVTHNRVDPFTEEHKKKAPGEKLQEEGEDLSEVSGRDTMMMIFKQEYATMNIGFNASLDLKYVGKPLYQKDKKGNEAADNVYPEEITRRIKAAIMAFAHLLNGVGSKQARALPILRVNEVIAVISAEPIPNATHGSYEDYEKDTIRNVCNYVSAINARASVYCYPKKLCAGAGKSEESSQGTKACDSVDFREYDNIVALLRDLAEEATRLAMEGNTQ